MFKLYYITTEATCISWIEVTRPIFYSAGSRRWPFISTDIPFRDLWWATCVTA